MFWAELFHHVCQLVIHVLLDVCRDFFVLWRDFPKDFGLHWPLCGECFSDGLGLEAHHSLCNHRMEHPAGSVPWFCALLHLQAQQFQTFCVGFLPIFAAIFVVLNVPGQVAGHRTDFIVGEVLGKVVIEAFFL